MAEKVHVTFLGTSASVPTARRSHPAVLLRYKDENILFDCGEGTQRQFRKAKLNPCKVTKVLLSHWHGDHVFGLPGFLQTLILNGYNRKLAVYGPLGSKRRMAQYLETCGIERGKLNLEVHEVEKGIFFESEEFYLEAMPMDHFGPTNGYSFVLREKSRLDKAKLEKLGVPNSSLVGELAKGKVITWKGKKIDGKKLLYKEGGRKFVYITDTRMCENAVSLSLGADYLVCESSFSSEEQERAKEYGHLTSSDAATIAKKAKVKNLVLFHLSQRYEEIPQVIKKEAHKIFKNVTIPEDLDGLEF